MTIILFIKEVQGLPVTIEIVKMTLVNTKHVLSQYSRGLDLDFILLPFMLKSSQVR